MRGKRFHPGKRNEGKRRRSGDFGRLSVAFFVGFVSLVIFPSCSSTWAHDKSISYSTWTVRDGEARVVVQIAGRDLANLPWSGLGGEAFDVQTGTYLTTRLELTAAGDPCAVTDGPRRLHGAAGKARYEWQVTCPSDGTLEIRSGLFEDLIPSHLHFARVERDDRSIERVLSASDPAWFLPEGETTGAHGAGTGVPGYVLLGIEHIATGYDHLVFLLALLLLGSPLLEVAKVVTGFTVAHSITLGLAAVGILEPDATSIEALIGLSIALVAAENLWLAGNRSRAIPFLVTVALGLLAAGAWQGAGSVPARTLAGLALFSGCYFALLARTGEPASLRWAVAFLFGLVHGFGFAGVLAEAELPPDRLVSALFGFNVGVEAGQLAIVAAVWPLLRLASRHASTGRLVTELGSATVAAVGIFWFVTRAY